MQGSLFPKNSRVSNFWSLGYIVCKIIEIIFGIYLTSSVPVDLLQCMHVTFLLPIPKPAHPRKYRFKSTKALLELTWNMFKKLYLSLKILYIFSTIFFQCIILNQVLFKTLLQLIKLLSTQNGTNVSDLILLFPFRLQTTVSTCTTLQMNVSHPNFLQSAF